MALLPNERLGRFPFFAKKVFEFVSPKNARDSFSSIHKRNTGISQLELP